MFSFTQLPWEFSNQAQELLKFAKSRVTSRTVARLKTPHGSLVIDKCNGDRSQSMSHIKQKQYIKIQ